MARVKSNQHFGLKSAVGMADAFKPVIRNVDWFGFGGLRNAIASTLAALRSGQRLRG